MSAKLGTGSDSIWKPEALLQNWRKVLGGTLFVVLGVSVLHGWAETFLERQERQTPQIAQIGTGSESLQGETWLEPLPVRIRKPIYWKFSLRNPLDRPVRVSVERFEATDLLIPGGGSDVLIRTEEKSDGVAWQDWETEMAPGGDASLWIKWGSPHPVGIHRLSATFSWKTLAEPTTAGTVNATLEDIQVIAPGRTFFAHVVRCFVTLLGILAVPMVIAIAGFGFQQRQQTLVQERQAWANMLPTSHENNKNHYILLLTAIYTFRRRYEGDRTSIEQLTFLLLLILRRLRAINHAGVAFHLKDRIGEKIVTTCIGHFVQALRNQLDLEDQISAILDQMDIHETYSSHQRRNRLRSRRKRLEALEEKVSHWLQDPEQARSFNWLFLAETFLKHDINRIYRFWYGDSPQLPNDTVAKYLRLLRVRQAQTRKEQLSEAEETLQQVEQWIDIYKERAEADRYTD